MCWKRRLARRLATATHPAAACASAAHLTSPAAASPPLPRLAQEYGALLSEAGFDSVAALDRTEEFRGHLARELAAAEGDRQGWVAAFSQEDYEEVTGSWRFKLDRVAAGELQWGLFRAFKQMSGRDYHEPEAPGDGFAALA
ncbi:hypothetical protein CHLNCDRAFT_141021 [Chlorella variabilis]|uniref:phosphoethanolamine N-methyltransferase n=1 Tax=Chlorella variabilis TaxID=554065 RepID=E1ZRZ8_CHLVA|nr:hypothetical protein CHLNCDRAFT_141021 [Chlorella variabilis]EFN51394.1 hypothetical protein CHLNCDRAFT_141021 [Chlorella variabilis]|eukprot:XP_005843496.1 hypothetical protein CHLNCDRAFT_141021 [Chlorella variabilis]